MTSLCVSLLQNVIYQEVALLEIVLLFIREEYYSPFWATIFYLSERLILINFATKEELCKAPRIGKKWTGLMVDERKKRKFSGFEDASTRLKKVPKKSLRESFSYVQNLPIQLYNSKSSPFALFLAISQSLANRIQFFQSCTSRNRHAQA